MRRLVRTTQSGGAKRWTTNNQTGEVKFGWRRLHQWQQLRWPSEPSRPSPKQVSCFGRSFGYCFGKSWASVGCTVLWHWLDTFDERPVARAWQQNRAMLIQLESYGFLTPLFLKKTIPEGRPKCARGAAHAAMSPASPWPPKFFDLRMDNRRPDP